MTVTLAQIHEDPAILDRAIASQETLEILSCGEVAATLMPRRVSAIEQARIAQQSFCKLSTGG